MRTDQRYLARASLGPETARTRQSWSEWLVSHSARSGVVQLRPFPFDYGLWGSGVGFGEAGVRGDGACSGRARLRNPVG